MRDTSEPLRSSELRHTVTIVAPAGTAAQDEQEIATGVPAGIAVLPPHFQAKEALAAGGLQMATVYTVSIRYRDDLRPDLVLVEECCTERRFQIIAIVPSDRRDAIDMTCVTAG